MVTVVILGAGFSGIGIAHKLLKYTLPKVNDLKVILVSVSTHHFWNLGSVRRVIPGEVEDEQIFREIAPGFEQYPKDAFEFVVGAATGLDVASNRAQVSVGGETRDIEYSHLVVATGSSYPTKLPFTTIGSHEEMLESWRELQDKVQQAKSIVISGAGPTGIETAAELASHFGDSKSITIILEGDIPLRGFMPQVGKIAANDLASFGAKLVRKARTMNSSTNDNGQTVVELSNGSILEADLYLPLYGSRPNTQFVPTHLLDDRGNLKLETNLRVQGLHNVWGVGDVGNLESKQLIYAERQALHLGSNIHAALTGGNVKPLPWTVTPQVFVTLGKDKGTGQYGWFKVPGFGVTTTKGKDFFMSRGDGLIAGKNIVRSPI
ncbi:unnamed protein product [Clonostachys rosea]|uniref:FAD/NAD(P)-binding domain-containing protein n=1 Tax=Bionectria ochroleuca TaxID=29856 RepID=A0ABY6TR19_BIOOC|nr:unnamed protein product [Clonostachys rosea]